MQYCENLKKIRAVELLFAFSELLIQFRLTLQRLKHVGFLYTSTSKYTRKHIRLMNFYKT